MNEIEQILKTGKSWHDESRIVPSSEEIEHASSQLNFSFPIAYMEFISLDGLAELGFNHTILSPSEIVEALANMPDQDHIPFGDNGCGDIYCWEKQDLDGSKVFFWDHETGQYSEDSESFTTWLKKNRK